MSLSWEKFVLIRFMCDISVHQELMQAQQMLQGSQFHTLWETRGKDELPIPQGHAYQAPKLTCCCFDRLPLQEAALQNYICLLSWLIVPVWHTLVPNSY